MPIQEDTELRMEIAHIKSPPRRNSLRPILAFVLLMLASYVIPIYSRNEFDFTSLSAFFSILGAAALWWESNHSDVQIIPDFDNLTDHRNLTIPGLGSIIAYALIAIVMILIGLSFLLTPNHHNVGIILLKSVITFSILFTGGVLIYTRYNRNAFDLQASVRANVFYVRNLPNEPSQEQLIEANRQIRQAAKRARNALRSAGFFFLLVGGCFVLVDELYKIWPDFHRKLVSLTW